MPGVRIKEWLNCGGNDRSFQIISDDEIVQNIIQANEQHEMQEDEQTEISIQKMILGTISYGNISSPGNSFQMVRETKRVWYREFTTIKTNSRFSSSEEKNSLRQIVITKYFKQH